MWTAIGGKRVTWANLFAVNDRESMIAAMDKLVPYMTDHTTTVGILNKLTPQIPVYFVSLPFIICGGLALMYFSFPSLLSLAADGFLEIFGRGQP